MRWGVILLCLTGCAPFAWTKPGEDPAMAKQAEKECLYEATKATAAIRNGVEAGYMKATIERQCMEAKGYSMQQVSR